MLGSQGDDLLYAKYSQCGKSKITCFVDIYQDSNTYLYTFINGVSLILYTKVVLVHVVVFSCGVYTSNMSSYFNWLSYITQKCFLTKLNIDRCTLPISYLVQLL